MPITNQALEQLAERLNVPKADQHKVLFVSEQLETHLKKNLSRCFKTRWTVHRVIRGGSISKGTAVRTKYDVDLIVLLNMKVTTFLSDDLSLQQSLKDGLVMCLEDHGGVNIDGDSLKNPWPHVKCTLYGVSFDVLIGVHMKKDAIHAEGLGAAQLNAVQDLILQARDFSSAANYARALSGTCAESINSIVREEEKCVKQCIILVKHWRMVHNLESFKSFVAEVIVLSAAHRLRLEDIELSCLTLFKRTIKFLDLHDRRMKNPRILRYGHLGLYKASEWSDLIEQNVRAGEAHHKRLLILNPMTPVLDVIYSVFPGKLKLWSETAEHTLSLMNKKKVSIKQIFGDEGPTNEMFASVQMPPALAAIMKSQMPAKRRS